VWKGTGKTYRPTMLKLKLKRPEENPEKLNLALHVGHLIGILPLKEMACLLPSACPPAAALLISATGELNFCFSVNLNLS